MLVGVKWREIKIDMCNSCDIEDGVVCLLNIKNNIIKTGDKSLKIALNNVSVNQDWDYYANIYMM